MQKLTSIYGWAALAFCATAARDAALISGGDIAIADTANLLATVVFLNLIGSASTDYVVNNLNLQGNHAQAACLLVAALMGVSPFHSLHLLSFIFSSIALAIVFGRKVLSGHYSYPQQAVTVEISVVAAFALYDPQLVSTQTLAALRFLVAAMIFFANRKYCSNLGNAKRKQLPTHFWLGCASLLTAGGLAFSNKAFILQGASTLELTLSRAAMYSLAIVGIAYNFLADYHITHRRPKADFKIFIALLVCIVVCGSVLLEFNNRSALVFSTVLICSSISTYLIRLRSRWTAELDRDETTNTAPQYVR